MDRILLKNVSLKNCQRFYKKNVCHVLFSRLITTVRNYFYLFVRVRWTERLLIVIKKKNWQTIHGRLTTNVWSVNHSQPSQHISTSPNILVLSCRLDFKSSEKPPPLPLCRLPNVNIFYHGRSPSPPQLGGFYWMVRYLCFTKFSIGGFFFSEIFPTCFRTVRHLFSNGLILLISGPSLRQLFVWCFVFFECGFFRFVASFISMGSCLGI